MSLSLSLNNYIRLAFFLRIFVSVRLENVDIRLNLQQDCWWSDPIFLRVDCSSCWWRLICTCREDYWSNPLRTICCWSRSLLHGQRASPLLHGCQLRPSARRRTEICVWQEKIFWKQLLSLHDFSLFFFRSFFTWRGSSSDSFSSLLFTCLSIWMHWLKSFVLLNITQWRSVRTSFLFSSFRQRIFAIRMMKRFSSFLVFQSDRRERGRRERGGERRRSLSDFSPFDVFTRKWTNRFVLLLFSICSRCSPGNVFLFVDFWSSSSLSEDQLDVVFCAGTTAMRIHWIE